MVSSLCFINSPSNWINRKLSNEKYSKYNQIKYPNIKISEFSIIRGTIIYNNTSKVDLENVVISTNENINLINGDIYLNNNKENKLLLII